MDHVKRTYGKKKSLVVVDKATELFEKATKLHLSSPTLQKKSEICRQTERKKASDAVIGIKARERGTKCTPKDTMANKTDHSSFMIFNSNRDRSETRKRKSKPEKKPMPKKTSKRGRREIKVTRDKASQKASTKSSPVHVSGSTPELVIEGLHPPLVARKSNKRNQDESQCVVYFDMKQGLKDVSSAKMSQGRKRQQVATPQTTVVGEESDKYQHDKISDKSSTSSHSSVEIARAKDENFVSVCQLPTSPLVDLVKYEELDLSDGDLSSMACDPESSESSMEISDEETNESGVISQETSMWVTTYTLSSVKNPSPLDNFCVKMRQQAILNSTANTAEDDINPLHFPNGLSPINQLTAELTPFKETRNNRYAPCLSRKKSKTPNATKEDYIAKCSTKLFNSSAMNDENEETPNLSKISPDLHFDVNDNISTTCEKANKNLPPTKTHVSINKNLKGSVESESKARNCQDPVLLKSGNGTESSKMATMLDKRRNQHKSTRENQQENVSGILRSNGQEKNLENLEMLKRERYEIVRNFSTESSKISEQSRNATKKRIKNKNFNASFTKATEREVKSSSSKVTMAHDLRSNFKECQFLVSSSTTKRFPKPILKKKRKDMTNYQGQLLLKNNLKSNQKFLMENLTHTDLEAVISDDSICFVNRLFIKSSILKYKNENEQT